MACPVCEAAKDVQNLIDGTTVSRATALVERLSTDENALAEFGGMIGFNVIFMRGIGLGTAFSSEAAVAQAERAAAAEAQAISMESAASTPVGRIGKPLTVQPGTNGPTKISGRQYSGHALDRMQERGLTPTVVEETIANGVQSNGNNGASVFTTGEARVIINSDGTVITVYAR